MNLARSRMTRIMASAALLSMVSIGGATSMAQAATISPPTVVSAPTAIAPSPATDTYTAQVLALINQKRAAVGAPAVKWNQKVGNVSQDWAEHLGIATKSDTFDWNTIHRSDAGGSLIPSGATWYREIVGFNFTPQSIVDWWMNSPSHKAAMLDPKATDIGIGYTVPTSGPYAGWHMVVSNLAAYPVPVVVTPGTQYKTTIQLNYRTGGGLTYPIVDYADVGTVVTATGNVSGIWYEVKVGDKTGWMSSDYLVKFVATASVTKTPIAVKAALVNDGLGAAISNEVYGLKNGGGYQCFQLGCIVYSPQTGAHISKGGIRSLWISAGSENGSLGYPTTDEVTGLKSGGVYQNFQNGAIVYSPSTGAHVSIGGIRSVWLNSGAEKGALGYPTTNEISGLRNGGVYQMYQNGAIVYSPATGAHISMGGIRSLWGSTGYERGRLGYPTSNEYAAGSGRVAQNYQGGVITWSSTGSKISYK